MTAMTNLPVTLADEMTLVTRLRGHDETAFEDLVRVHGGRLLHVARRFLSDEDARDAVQDAFLSAFKAIDRFDGKSRIATWLHRILVNSCLMRLRKPSYRQEESIEPLLPSFLEDGHRKNPGVAWPESADDMLQKSEVRRLVRRSIGELPDNYRSVLLLRDIEGLSGAETAERLDLKPNAVKVRLHRARQALRERLDPHFRGGGDAGYAGKNGGGSGNV